MIPVKVCGITRMEDARLAVDLGASALGFIFYPESPRYIPPEKARAIVSAVGDRAAFVGVFVDESPQRVNEIAGSTGLSFIQLHGGESPEVVRQMELPVIKALRMKSGVDPVVMALYSVHAWLLDTYQPGQPGGTGRTFDWRLTDRFPKHQPLILSGGLNPANILQGIRQVHPAAVDVNSGVESSPGIKDPQKLEDLFRVLQETSAPGRYPHNIFMRQQ